MTNYNSTKIFILVLLFITIANNAQNPKEFLSFENRLKFGDHLFCEGDYIRAIDEYNFILSKRKNDTLQFKIGLAYQKLGRFDDAELSFKKLLPNSSLNNEADFEYYRSTYLSNDFVKLKEDYVTSSYHNVLYNDDIQKLFSLTNLYTSSEEIDSSSFFKPFNERESIELLKFYLRKMNFNDKSPALAAIMSAVVPGLGKIYTENYGDGITALLLTGVLTFLSVDNFNAEHDFRGYLFAGLAAYFYAGNIYGSAASAQIYNANLRISFDNDLKIFLNGNNHFVPKSKWFCD